MVGGTCSASLNRLPSELHDCILQLACDGSCYPTPAISLSRVSHYWNDVARPHIYTVLRLDLRSLPKLLPKLQHLPSKDRCVRILRIDDDDHASGDDVEDGLRYQACFVHLLTLASLTLRSLTIRFIRFMYATSSLNYVWSTPFPELETLEMNGYYPFPRPPPVGRQTTTDGKEPSTATNFPCLEKLILDGVANPFGLLGEGILDASAPRLRILEIHGIRYATFFVVQIRDALSSRIVDCKWPNQSRGAIPQDLQALYLTVDSESEEDGRKACRREVLMWEQMLRELDVLMNFVGEARWKEGKRVDIMLANRLKALP